ncbi:LOW QUALITY PROTEIN: phenylserine dehydratase-like [Menidia menidia]
MYQVREPNASGRKRVPGRNSRATWGQSDVTPQQIATILRIFKMADGVTLALLEEARRTVSSSPLGVIKTPMILWGQTSLPPPPPLHVHIKLENMQTTGSFKIRGVANQFARRPAGGRFVTMSAGNYGKAFAFAAKHYGISGKVVMPDTAPESRSTLIQGLGVEVERVPTPLLLTSVQRCVQQEAMSFLHSYDDLDLIAGHASLGLELLEAVPRPDVVVVCCGGGGLLAGVAAAVRLSGLQETRVYGVEPEGACTMHQSLLRGAPVEMDARSVASGLAPPSAGLLPFRLCERFGAGVVLVSEQQLRAAVASLFSAGLVVEPSGAAAFAAIANDRIPELEGRSVVCVLSGGNVGKEELAHF